MLIRSQDKTQLTDFAGCTAMVNMTDEVVVFGNNQSFEDPPMTVGVYSSKEKAIKVLDMIANTYVGTLWTDTNMIIANRAVFEMPQDDEVEV